MANIPTLQIPNVSSGVGNLSMAPAGAVRIPKIATMPVLGREVFDGVGAGAIGLSRGVWEGAQMLTEFSDKMAAANDDFQYAAADRAFSEALAEHEVESSRLSPDKHTELWKTKYLPKLQTQVEGMKVTPDGRARLNAFYQRQAGNSTAAITVEANKKFLESGKAESDALIERKINEGDDEAAMAENARGVALGYRTKEEGMSNENKIIQDRKISNWRGYIQQKPAEAVRVFRDAQASGKYPNGLRPEEVMQLRREAEGQHGQLLQDFTNNLLERLETDSAAITDETIETAFSDPQIDAPRELKDKLINARSLKYADTPQGKAEKDEYYSDLWQKLFAYDAEKDASMSNPDAYMRNYQKLQQEIISTAPEGERKPFLDKLNESVSKAKEGRKDRSDQIAAGLTDLTKKLADWGQLGDDGGWKKVKKGEREVEVPQDWNAYGKVQSKRNEITTAVRQMLRENPDLTEEEAYERFKGVLEDKLDGGAKFMQGPDEESWWQKLLPFVQGPYANNPNVMTAGISWGSSSLTEGLDKDEPLPPVATTPNNEVIPMNNGKLPASIRNNNAGAMWPAVWQKKFGGNFGENLADGKGNKIAKFPTPTHGAAATMYLLGNPDYMYSKKSVADAIATWSNAKGSSLQAYIKAFTAAGFSSEEKVGDIMSDPQKAIAFTKIMSRFEAGRDFPLDEQGWQQAFSMFQEA
jgi:hypothetical protein